MSSLAVKKLTEGKHQFAIKTVTEKEINFTMDNAKSIFTGFSISSIIIPDSEKTEDSINISTYIEEKPISMKTTEWTNVSKPIRITKPTLGEGYLLTFYNVSSKFIKEGAAKGTLWTELK
jgi:hypothetical protein